MTVPGLFDRSIATHPRDPAVSLWTPRFERKVSSEELARRVARVAAGLIALGLKKGDRVVTSGGLHGTIVGVKEDVVVLKIAEDVKVEVSRSAVADVREKSTE